MRVCLYSCGTVSAVKSLPTEEKTELVVFGFGGMGEVSYERELKGETRYFEDAALLSKTLKNVVVCGCVTDTCGHKRRSALVAENGKLLGVSDMLHAVDGETGSGAALRVYDTKIGKMGVVVAGDLRFPEAVKALALCGSDFIVCPCDKVGEIYATLACAHAYAFGVPVVLCANGYAAVAGCDGKLTIATKNADVIELQLRKEYHLVETRRRLFIDET